MKKLYFLASLAVATLSFTSCEADKEPVYHDPDPATFVLNTPPMAEQLYLLENGGTVELTTSQPDYGVATVTQYSVDITLADTFVEATESSEANYLTLSSKQPTQAKISLDANDFDEAICQLQGITSFAEYPEEGLDPVKVTLRTHAWISGFESSECVSNEIVLKAVQPYNPYSETGRSIYIVGSVSGWAISPADPTLWALKETGIKTNIYVGAFDIPAGEQYFRFYTALGDWGSDGQLPSVGPNANDGENEMVTLTDEPVKHSAVPGKGAWYTSADWEGGFVTFTVDLNDESAITVTMQKGNFDYANMKYIYLVGEPSAWSVNADNAEEIYADYKLYDYDSNGIYSGTFEVPEGKSTFRFYTQLGSWDEEFSLGAQVEDNPVEGAFDNGVFTGSYVVGKGSWTFPAWTGGKMKMTVNTNDKTVTYEAV